MANTYLSKQEILQNYGILFENIKNHTDVASKISEYGYNEEKIAKGKELYSKVNEMYLKNIEETQLETSAYKLFKESFDAVLENYRSDKKRIRVVFKENQDVLKNLRLVGRESYSHANLLDDMFVMYNTLQKDETLKEEVAQFKVTSENIDKQLLALEEVKKLLAAYTLKKGDKQQSTKNANQSFDELSKWVRKFFEVAKLALEDQPQLLESLTKVVK